MKITGRWRLATIVTTVLLAATATFTTTAVTADDASALSPFHKIGYADFQNNSTISPDGTNDTYIGRSFAGDMDWTPDGLKQVYRTNGEIWIRNQDGRTFPVGVSGQAPAISNDGTMIAYETPGAVGQTSIEVVDLQGTPIASLGLGGAPAWSYDNRLAFTRRADGPERDCGSTLPGETIKTGSNGIWVTTLGGSGGWAIEPGVQLGGGSYLNGSTGPSWSPSGQIVFTGYVMTISVSRVSGRCVSENPAGTVMTVSGAGGVPNDLTADNDFFNGHASYSPDGDFIAFASARNVAQDGGIHSLWLMTASGGNPTLVKVTQAVYTTDWLTALPVGEAVTVQAIDPDADECGPDPATMFFERSGVTDGPVELNIRVKSSSTATEGEDFDPLPSTITIPDGASGVNLPIFPKSDDVSEGDETLIVEILDADGFLVGEPNEATVTIKDGGASCDPVDPTPGPGEPEPTPDPGDPGNPDPPTVPVRPVSPPPRVGTAPIVVVVPAEPPPPVVGEITGGSLRCALDIDSDELNIRIPPALSVWFDQDENVSVVAGGGSFNDTLPRGGVIVVPLGGAASVNQVVLNATLITGADYTLITSC